MNNTVPFIPENAPFTPEQRGWLNGYFAGIFSREPVQGMASTSSLPVKPISRPLKILYGSQTGTAEGLAYETAERAQAKGFEAEVLELDSCEAEQLLSAKRVLVITSTYGDGEMPDNAQSFWSTITAETAPKLSGISYSVCALGDTNYETFCTAGREIDERLGALGASKLRDRVDCDVDYEDLYEQWVEESLSALLSEEGEETVAAVKVDASVTAKKAATYSKKKPFTTKLIENRELTLPGSGKEVRHFSIALPETEIPYKVGDALSVCSKNHPGKVDALLELLKLDGESPVKIAAGEMSLREAMTSFLEIRNPTKPWATQLADKTLNAELVTLLADAEVFSEFLYGREIFDFLKAFPADWTAQEWVDTLKPLQARAYSISSSPKAHPDEVHLTIAAVRYESQDRVQEGICSTFLANAAVDQELEVYLTPNKHFTIPEDANAPMIMVGPGTGVAPFRAFLEERQATGAGGQNWLFFGDRSSKTDFLYESEFSGMLKDGILNRLDLAWSRDQEEKIYVQDRMRAQAEELYAWLENGGYFFVCGDAYRMAKDVEAALLDVIASQGGKTPEEANAYLANMKKEKRYVRDVY